jgi:hypothetical protein
MVIAQQGILGDHVAPQQSGDSPMLLRWDTLLIAVAVVGGSVLIENSHRIDTAAPDDEVTASAPSACVDTQVTATIGSGDQRDDNSGDVKSSVAIPPTLPICSDE